jgi:hypothetical protein
MYIGVTNYPHYLRTIAEITVVGTETVFNGLLYDPSSIDVFHKGLRLLPSEYNATDGTSLTLAITTVAGDKIELVSKSEAYSGTVISGSGGGGVWGTITGTLSNQADLEARLQALTAGGSGATVDYASVVAALGFRPVEQGGGNGQSAVPNIHIGFGSNSRLKASVDSTDLGNIVFDSNLGSIASQSAANVSITGGTVANAIITNSTINGITVGTNATGTRWIGTSVPTTQGVNGDIYYEVF